LQRARTNLLKNAKVLGQCLAAAEQHTNNQAPCIGQLKWKLSATLVLD
jgi:hypothetical protein